MAAERQEAKPDPAEALPLLAGPKRQHFLPRFYLEGFVGPDGCVAVFDRDRDQLRRQQPQNTGVEGHLYTFRDQEGRQRFELERELARVEGEASRILPKLISGAPLENEERSSFSYFTALFAVRTPEFLESLKQFNGELIKMMTRAAFSDVDHVMEILRAKPEHVQTSDGALREEAAQLVEFAQGDGYRVSTDHMWAIGMALPMAEAIAPLMHARHWRVLAAPAGKSFITSDVPVHLTTAQPRKDRFWGVGFGSADALVLVPLSSTQLLAMYGETGETDHRRGDPEMVRRINVGMAKGCQRFLIARDDELVTSIAKASGIVNMKWRPKFSMN